MSKRTRIICTMGPSVDDDDLLRSLIISGMDVARLNFSHGTHEEQAGRIERIKRIRSECGTPTAIMLDTKGPEIRIGMLPEPRSLARWEKVTLSPVESASGDAIPQTYANLAAQVHPGDRILLDDGLIELKVKACNGEEVHCEVLNPGTLKSRKSLNVPGVSIPFPAITEQDKADIAFGLEQGVDFVALSFVKTAEAVRQVRSYIQSLTDENIGIIAKIENADAVANVAEIIKAADAVMVARGDLGVEVPEYEVPHLQKRIIRKCNAEHKPVIIATQMLESMTANPRPTRAEATDVANAIYDGADCVMLSGETAAGQYPIEAISVMAKIAEVTEKNIFDDGFQPHHSRGLKSVSHAVGIAAVQTALDVDARCIVCPTMTGRSARLISSLRPKIPIYAVSPSSRVMRSMQLFWGVTPMLGDVQGNMKSVIENARDVVYEAGHVEEGDIAVFTCGDRFTSPVQRFPDGSVERFAPANVMYVVQIHPQEMVQAVDDGTGDALMTYAFFDRSSSPMS